MTKPVLNQSKLLTDFPVYTIKNRNLTLATKET